MPPEAAPARHVGPLLVLGAGLLAAVALAAGTAVAVARDDRIVPGVTVAGVPVGGLDAATAMARVDPALAGAAPVPAAELVLTTPDGVVLLPTADLGIVPDPAATVTRALAVGRTGRPDDLAVRVLSVVRRSVGSRDVAPVLRADPGDVRAGVDMVADRLDRPADPGDVRIDPATLDVTMVAPRGGVTVRRDEAVAAIVAAVAAGDRGAIALPADVTPAPPTAAALEALAEDLRGALRTGLVLVADGRRIRVEPAELAAAATVVVGPDDAGRTVPMLHLDRRRLARSVGARIVAAFDRDAIDAGLVAPEPPRFAAMGTTSFRPLPAAVALDPGRTERRFRMERTARQLEGMIRAGRTAEAADLLEVAPDVTAADLARHALPTHLLGTFTTFHPAGADRNENIRRLADAVDGALVAPGAELSVNGISGERRCEDGYLPAGTIVRGELVDTCGGGVSQFGTTAYNAAFFAGLPTPQWQPHSFHIGRYPMGREATLSFPILDVRAVNDTDGWLLVRTSHTATSVTVALYGVPRWAEVRAVHGEPVDPRPFPTELRPAPDLPPGQERVLQPGGDGFTIEVARELVPPDGGPPLVERTTTVYRPQTRIVEVGLEAGAGSGPGGATDPAVVAPPG